MRWLTTGKRGKKRGWCASWILRKPTTTSVGVFYEGLEKMGFGVRVGWIGCGGVSQRQNFLSLLTGLQQASSPVLRGNFISGCRLRGRGDAEIMVSHLLFADDTIIFCEASKDQAARIGSFPVKYLGLPLGARHKALPMWDGVEEEMRRRTCPMPKSVVKRLEKLQRDSLWGGGNTGRKIHLVNWKVVCTQKEKGGLGIRRIGSLNKALLGQVDLEICRREGGLVEEGNLG
ncbi:hypothetical protein CK203_076996 [Vitis vinifera]|uniref:Reverse transcriptase domain-containing protein n=1 Tax=Vitis vinifera TaxID=29760 RepID=A0A438DZU5_VITVI|nr:hypothetical protein CK203_076996 [Vitis vinifera]